MRFSTLAGAETTVIEFDWTIKRVIDFGWTIKIVPDLQIVRVAICLVLNFLKI